MFVKDSDAVLDYAVDWSEACAGERTILGSQWRATPEGLTLADEAMAATHTGIRISGGAAGRLYCVGNRVNFSDGTSDERTLTLRVEER